MRIVGGAFAGRGLTAPAGTETRPTSDRVREALFNILAHREWNLGRDVLEGALVLDVCCGTGAVALEAISRGADYAFLVDQSPEALIAAQSNVSTFGVPNQCRIIRADARQLPRATRPCNLIFIDPPYRQNLPAQIVPGLIEGGWVAHKSLLVVETARGEPLALPDSCSPQIVRDYGDTALHFFVYK